MVTPRASLVCSLRHTDAQPLHRADVQKAASQLFGCRSCRTLGLQQRHSISTGLRGGGRNGRSSSSIAPAYPVRCSGPQSRQVEAPRTCAGAADVGAFVGPLRVLVVDPGEPDHLRLRVEAGDQPVLLEDLGPDRACARRRAFALAVLRPGGACRMASNASLAMAAGRFAVCFFSTPAGSLQLLEDA